MKQRRRSCQNCVRMMSSSASKTPPGPAETKIVRQKEAAPMVTCPICFRIQENSTTIIECMHSFCENCITKKLTEKKPKCCPVCYADLGCTPLDKLRSDNNLQILAAKFFPSTNKETVFAQAEDEEAEMPSIPNPARRKKRSVSSFINTSKEKCETIPNRKRKRIPKKIPSFVSNEEAVRNVEDRPESSTSRKNTYNRKKLNLSQCSKQQNSREDGLRNVWDLNFLAEAEDTTKGNKPSSKGIVFKTPQSTIPKEKPNFSKGKGKEIMNVSNFVNLVDDDDDDVDDEKEAEDYIPKSSSQGIVLGTSRSTIPKGKECGSSSKYVTDDDDDDDDDDDYEDPTPARAPSVSVKLKRKGRGRPKKAVALSEGGVRVSAQAIVDANAASERKPNSVWLSLVATYRQDVGPPLPQIPTCYLRIKDVHLTVSILKKYLVRKLDLHSEDEVEIELLGRPLPSSMELYMLLKLWGREVASERIMTSVGSSTRDFVMLLSYSRKA